MGNCSSYLNGWVTPTVITPGSQKTMCTTSLCESIFNVLHWRSQRQLMQSIILMQEPSFTWRFCIPLPLALFCIIISWSSLVAAQPASPLTLNLGPLYDFCQPWRHGIFGFPSLKNYSHTMLQQEATVSTFRGKVLRYSPVATTFSIYYCQLETITMTCGYDIFTGKTGIAT